LASFRHIDPYNNVINNTLRTIQPESWEGPSKAQRGE